MTAGKGLEGGQLSTRMCNATAPGACHSNEHCALTGEGQAVVGVGLVHDAVIDQQLGVGLHRGWKGSRRSDWVGQG